MNSKIGTLNGTETEYEVVFFPPYFVAHWFSFHFSIYTIKMLKKIPIQPIMRGTYKKKGTGVQLLQFDHSIYDVASFVFGLYRWLLCLRVSLPDVNTSRFNQSNRFKLAVIVVRK